MTLVELKQYVDDMLIRGAPSDTTVIVMNIYTEERWEPIIGEALTDSDPFLVLQIG